MAANAKDIIYVDVDDEITGIIDKVTSADAKVVALVLPKRAAVFQSIVNMKLLKHRADSAKKHLVLITSEAGLMPLAGATGVHVAKTLQSKPEIPIQPVVSDLPEDIDEDEPMSLGDDFNAEKEATKPIGDLAKSSSAMSAASQMPEETIELDNTNLSSSGDAAKDTDVAAMAAGGGAGKAGKKGKKDKKLNVPNFEKFRLKLVLGVVVLVLLIVGWILANNVLPKAMITIKTNTSNVNSTLTPTLDTAATAVDTVKQIVPAKVEQVQKTYSQQAAASGKQNNGNKASGTITVTNCGASTTTLPAGTGFSSNGLTFISTQSANIPSSNFDFFHACKNDGKATVTVTAQSGGTSYNLSSGASYTIAGNPSNMSATGSDMTGGTDSIVTVVQQSDIDGAKQKADASVDKNAIKTQLQQTLQNEGEYAFPDSFAASTPAGTASANVGDQVASVTYTENVTYTMFGAKQSDLSSVISTAVDQQIDTSKQDIQDNGLSSAVITVPNPGTATKVQLSVQLTSIIGPHLDVSKLKAAIVGQKSGDVQSTIKNNPGVQSVVVKFSPFWVDHVPKNTSKITVVFEKSS